MQTKNTATKWKNCKSHTRSHTQTAKLDALVVSVWKRKFAACNCRRWINLKMQSNFCQTIATKTLFPPGNLQIIFHNLRLDLDGISLQFLANSFGKNDARKKWSPKWLNFGQTNTNSNPQMHENFTLISKP